MKLVDDWKQAWSWYSMHGAALLAALSAFQVLLPQAAAIIPPTIFPVVTGALALVIGVGRIIDQVRST